MNNPWSMEAWKVIAEWRRIHRGHQKKTLRTAPSQRRCPRTTCAPASGPHVSWCRRWLWHGGQNASNVLGDFEWLDLIQNMLFLAFLKKHAIISSIIISFRSLLRGLAGTDPYDPEFFMGNQYRPFFFGIQEPGPVRVPFRLGGESACLVLHGRHGRGTPQPSGAFWFRSAAAWLMWGTLGEG
jgi:hypothetical protein